MMNTKKYDLEDRLVDFAANVIFYCKELPHDMIGKYYGNQLLRSSGSSALNFGEAQGTNTIKDKINKLTLILKELKESRVNLKILHKTDYGASTQRLNLLNETQQLIRIIATIINNKKREL